ncbi:hypothetical protein B0T18DRAFT_163561 [Schizothecium vesticola]|uniref:6-phosphogluconate dehydrogenase NADP-binding domain-containing protein n=1 Tax=Schizothecium vesticola TaxID=314040 RepID=A0AA40EX28_9PEZI|nr:hypothetical protein B0T18DRAFT_163561 [Schizothecium vesticola]
MSAHGQPLTFLGVGNMGLAAILTLLQAGFPTTIWNRTLSRPQVTTATTAGATLSPDIASAVSSNDTILICLLDYPSILASLSAVSLTGKTIINLTNGTPKQALAMRDWAKAKGARHYLDGAIMVTPQMVGGPQSFLVVSGEDEDAFAAVQNVLSKLGTAQYLGPDTTAAARFDLAALATMYGMFAGGLVGMGLLKRGAGSSGKMAGVVKEGIAPFLMALVPYLGVIAEAWDEERWGDNLGNPLGMQLEGIKNIMAGCEDEGVDSALLGALARVMERAVDEFGGDVGLTVVGKLVMKNAE